MATLHIQCTDTGAANAVIEVFQRGTNGQPDTLVQSGLVASTGASTEVAMPEGCYVVVRAASEGEAKTIDNW